MERLLLLNQEEKDNIISYMPQNMQLYKIADFFQNFSDITRLKILSCLSMSDLCVNDISKLLNINQTTISHQLKNLKSQNLVKCARNGKIIKYSLTNHYINDIMLFAVESIKQNNNLMQI